jgi:hypothetical protein
MIGNPENSRRVLLSSRYRVEVSRILMAKLNESLFDTNQAIGATQELIARSDRLIECIARAYPAESK